MKVKEEDTGKAPFVDKKVRAGGPRVQGRIKGPGGGHSCLSMDQKTSCLLMDPENHERSIKRHEVFGSIKRREISLRETQKLVHQST